MGRMKAGGRVRGAPGRTARAVVPCAEAQPPGDHVALSGPVAVCGVLLLFRLLLRAEVGAGYWRAHVRRTCWAGKRTVTAAMSFWRPRRMGLRWERGHSSEGFLRREGEGSGGSEAEPYLSPPPPRPRGRAHVWYCRFFVFFWIVSASHALFCSTTWPHSSTADSSSASSHCSWDEMSAIWENSGERPAPQLWLAATNTPSNGGAAEGGD